MTELVECPECKGAGANRFTGFVDGRRKDGTAFGEFRDEMWQCSVCQGSGQISVEHWRRIELGKRLKAQRRSMHLTGSERAKQLGVGDIEYNHAEYGRPVSDSSWSKIMKGAGL